MMQLREHWEGVSLPGDYLLGRWLSSDEGGGFFETSLPADGRRAVVKLAPASAAGAAAQLALWQRTRALQHPHLRELVDCGGAELGDEAVLYAVFENADDTLAAALGQAPLTEAEAREVLEAVRGALQYLDAQGLSHAALDPEHVVAVGDRIKLSSDTLVDATADKPYTDMLRAFWYRISPCTPARSAEILAQALGEPAPVKDLPAEEVAPPAVAMQGRTPAPVAPDAAASGPPALGASTLGTPTLGKPASGAPVPESTPRPSHRAPRWVFVGAAAVVLLILGLNLRRSPDVPRAENIPRTAAPIMAAPVPKQPPEDPKPSPLAKRTKPVPIPAGKAMWRVIAFTYRSHETAARKAAALNQRYHGFEAMVFSPRDQRGYYLVALGGRMTREDAVRLQSKARAAGVAKDIYVQNYVE